MGEDSTGEEGAELPLDEAGDDAALIAGGGEKGFQVMLQDAVKQERRPLSWVVGDQTVIKPDLPSHRDRLREERSQQTELRSPDSV